MKGRLSESGLSAPLWGEINATCYAGGFLLSTLIKLFMVNILIKTTSKRFFILK